MTILLIDDDEDDRKLFFEATAEYDDTIKYVAAANAREALLYLNNTANALPEFIFLDLRMPGLSGEQCLIEIKKDPRIASIPVIIYTTSRDEKESARLKKLGAAHFMSKPVLPDDVYYMVSFVLGEKWG
ncbi:response regulator [Niastella sp. OAS944]|uniref:response regulator n=1 Tax=Niastella sp. OAS944 TaxID=2664089 RepID=UPI003481C6E4|nr:CheY-like chemotaxis protein [Chitinophagaceae bacterium OAS944]